MPRQHRGQHHDHRQAEAEGPLLNDHADRIDAVQDERDDGHRQRTAGQDARAAGHSQNEVARHQREAGQQTVEQS